MSYMQIKSRFIRKKIKGRKWSKKNRAYIGELMELENEILGRTNMAKDRVLAFNTLAAYHAKDFINMAKELRPNDFAVFIESKRKEADRAFDKFTHETDKTVEKEEKMKEKLKADWKALGGVI